MVTIRTTLYNATKIYIFCSYIHELHEILSLNKTRFCNEESVFCGKGTDFLSNISINFTTPEDNNTNNTNK